MPDTIKPREPRVPSYKRSEYLYQLLTEIVEQLRTAPPRSPDVASVWADQIEERALDTLQGREPKEARK